ncbi:heme oxygenase (staphylobilin-producing) [Psychrobacillus psychrotolerans]|uniref:Heme oxygenase (Staphylobilin-producing) n=1 Tax=Psychrobacillus psychrotolerans TaxID=126156 RepID=A0A1I6ADL5_9BACI|nr:heme oxygenase [Psychrobacillus psychrotolerans]SFQ66732.1 heme oxygenase (staphylobilin-producing) [Psychrobacillus psychrotolerans]
MIIVTNRIKTKPGFAEKMAPNFTKPSPLQEMEGFIKVEVAITQGPTEYDEMNVNMYWEKEENFQAWKDSDLFKESHKRPESGSPEASKESPLLGNELIISKVAASIEAISKN